MEWPAQPIRAWLAILAEPLARYDNPVVLEALGGAMSAPIFCGLVSAAGDWLVLHIVPANGWSAAYGAASRSFRGSTDALDVQVVQPEFRVCAG